jgi:ribosomal protein S18 acetylase RimI-like enzyme
MCPFTPRMWRQRARSAARIVYSLTRKRKCGNGMALVWRAFEVGQMPRKKRVEVTIRAMDIEDLSAVYRLGESLFTSEEYPILYRTWDPFEVTGMFTSDPEYCLVAEANGQVVGFVLATTVVKEGTAWKRYGYLNWIGISDGFQRVRLGYRLYRKLEETFREDGVRMVIADTVVENEKAIGFFRRLGFTVSGGHVWLSKTLRRDESRDVPTETPQRTNRGVRLKGGPVPHIPEPADTLAERETDD